MNMDALVDSARIGFRRRDWPQVAKAAQEMLDLDSGSDDGWYFKGLSERAAGQISSAISCFEECLARNERRHDAAIELANMYSKIRRNSEAAWLINNYAPLLQNSPRYLDLAGTVCIQIGMPETAWPLYKRANELQPNLPIFQANLANCATYVGEFEVAADLYRALIAQNPTHRQNHFFLSRVSKAKDMAHIDQMLKLLKEPDVPANHNTPILFALGKEFEDLEHWDKAFEYYRLGNAAAASEINYAPGEDIAFINHIIGNCTKKWFGRKADQSLPVSLSSPIFIVGLPRTGTTLVERILSSHSCVSSLGETLFVPTCAAGIASEISGQNMSIYSPQGYDAFMHGYKLLPERYLSQVSYRVGAEPYFIEKLPLNYLFLGPIAKAWPDAKFVVLNRGSMDTGFSLFKQVFTWAYKFSYNLEHIANYFLAYQKIMTHWKSVLGDRLIEVEYEQLTQNPGEEIRGLLKNLDIPFEEACENFEHNQAASTTASLVQVRSGMSTASVNRWKKFENELAPLKDILVANGLKV